MIDGWGSSHLPAHHPADDVPGAHRDRHLHPHRHVGDFMGPLIYISDDTKMPLALGVQYITSTGRSASPAVELRHGGVDLLTLPMIVIYYSARSTCTR